ncbi:MAG TPA: hypothetical protein VF752_10370 [Thermoleophilaceae bacterium]
MCAQRDDRHHFVRLQVFLPRHRLDRDLADGADSGSTAAHARRAEQLERRRRGLAVIVGQMIDAAERPPERGMGSGMKFQVEQIRASRTPLCTVRRNGRSRDLDLACPPGWRNW